MEYVDDAAAAATPLGAAIATEEEYSSPTARVVAAAAAMMETEAQSASDAYAMQSEEEAMDLGSFLESESTAAAVDQQLSEVDTQVARAMALEIHEHAQAMLDAQEMDAEMLVEMSAETETEAEAEAETEAEMEAEVEAEVDAEAEVEADPTGLSAEDLAQEMMDKAAESADAKAEQADKKEEAKDVAKATADGIPIGVVPVVPVAPAAAPKVVVQLPEDLSVEHQQALQANTAATATVRGALGEVGAILASKDNIIRSLVANTSYLTLSVGKLANQIDLQRSYIRLLQDKLKVAGLKNRELHAHVAHSADTVVAVRSQLAAVEQRLNKQDKTTVMLAGFLKQNEDSAALPPISDNVEVRGTPVKKLKAASQRRAAKRSNVHMRPVAGTQTFARPAARFDIGSFFNGPAAPAFFQPLPYRGGLPIPTIVVEETDDGR
jgi:hypothetical protein